MRLPSHYFIFGVLIYLYFNADLIFGTISFSYSISRLVIPKPHSFLLAKRLATAKYQIPLLGDSCGIIYLRGNVSVVRF